MTATPIQTRWYRQGYQDGVREAEARTIERCARRLEELGVRYCQGHDLPAAIRALKDSK